LARGIDKAPVDKLYCENAVCAAKVLGFGHRSSCGWARANLGCDRCKKAGGKQGDNEDTQQQAPE